MKREIKKAIKVLEEILETGETNIETFTFKDEKTNLKIDIRKVMTNSQRVSKCLKNKKLKNEKK